MMSPFRVEVLEDRKYRLYLILYLALPVFFDKNESLSKESKRQN